jgi:hypothetical protein
VTANVARRLSFSVLVLTALGACATSGTVGAAAGPDDAAVAYSGERVAAGVGTDQQAAAGVRLDESAPVAAGVETQDRGGAFGGLAFGF